MKATTGKILALCIALAMMAGMATPAFAAESDFTMIDVSAYVGENGFILSFYNDHATITNGLEVLGRKANWDDFEGIIDSKGNIVVPIQYNYAKYLNNDVVVVAKGKEYGSFGVIDTKGTIKVPLVYDYVKAESYGEGLIAAKKGEKFGYVDMNGTVVIPFQYESASAFSEGLAAVVLNNKLGFIDSSNRIVIPFLYNAHPHFIDVDGEPMMTTEYYEASFQNGKAVVQKGQELMLIDKTGEYVGECQKTNPSPAVDKSKFEIVSKEIVIPNPNKGKPIDGMFSINTSDGSITQQVESDFTVNKWGLVDRFGNEILPLVYDEIKSIGDGVFFARKDGNAYMMIHKDVAGSVSVKGTATAAPTASKVLVNGAAISFDAYNIDGNNYFKLRDLAYALNGSAKQFEVTWDGTNNAILLTSGTAYTLVGGEMEGKEAVAKAAVPTSSKILLDGKGVALTAYNIGGNNYFKLRDIGQAFDFGITWDGMKNTISIDAAIGYTE